MSDNVKKLVRAIDAGRIRGAIPSHGVLKISIPTFWRWVRDAQEAGYRFKKNPPGGAKRGKTYAKAQPWTVTKRPKEA